MVCGYYRVIVIVGSGVKRNRLRRLITYFFWRVRGTAIDRGETGCGLLADERNG